MSNSTIDYRTLVAEAEGEDYPQIEHIAYEFSKRTFNETKKSGVYNDDVLPVVPE